MNAISYISGDTQITDFPAASARPLAAFVQLCNDLLAGPDGYLSPENSFLALELGWQTVGTADAPDTVIHAWVAELLTSPAWGVVQYADNAAVEAIFGIADLHRALAAGDMPSIAAWDSADRAARAVSATSAGAEVYAVRTAYQSTALVDTEHWATLDAVTGNALRAHAPATEGTGAARIGEVTRHAIRSWRRLTQLTAPESVACCVRSRGVETWRYGQLRARDVRRNTVPAAMLCRRITPWIRPAATMNSYMDALPDPVSDLPAPA